MNETLIWLFNFTWMYPGFMALFWICGAIYYYFHWERKDLQLAEQGPLVLSFYPKVTLLVPCYNEGANVDETIGHLLNQKYPNLDIVAINDGSKDDTGDRLDVLAAKHSHIRVLHQPNQGKAMALNNGIKLANGEILVCIDGDAILAEDAVGWMVKHFIENKSVGAVTGNPRVRTRSTVVGKIQTGEFSSIIGLIKRAQRIYGTVFTVSGVVVAFRREAIDQIDGWNTDMVTEDIDISWRLQMAGWHIHYQPFSLCWVLMPETIRGLYKQRLRWAQGGAEVFLRYGFRLLLWRHRRFWPLMLEYVCSIFWCYTILLMALLLLFFPSGWDWQRFVLYSWTGMLLTGICFLQFSVSYFIDSHYEKRMGYTFLYCIWYPLIYWLMNVLTVVVAVPKAVIRKRGKLAVWESPDRGEEFRDEK
ncbi:biofilm PGA synthesis N-glycosyltransferase PgaC [Oceanisphaera litoralis]|uniref:poly-beta-1,6-N-acetyl-D-glucosamine synthase n=1 Tax=Oceanisphaera litoralis TaxID=225144 RepID=UPI00195C5E96|nr:poly-beta-1,6-N-acetyl-D-glucosamine synthase [Oceanisphaera litoralis]MBM7455475.1 biofilm PGA synthesis N-glycosyltransferase PgaC [Oceanisphaera litoralis]